MVLDVLRSVQNHTRVVVGCMDCMVFEESDGGAATILYLERWDSKAALDRHIRSNIYIRILHAMDLADEPPEISFYEVFGETGLEVVHELRK
jgi:quinol monooxygenase YgiN